MTETNNRIAIACDHAAVDFKSSLKSALSDWGFDVVDLGTDETDSVDYPDFADKLADALRTGQAGRGVLVCGTGIGISIAANRHNHVRAALCHDATDARLAREHNDANVIAFGARTMGSETALDSLRIFLDTPFDGGERHARRVAKLGRGVGGG